MTDLARETILDHYRYPRNHGSLPNPTHSHEATNATCGDNIRLDLRVVEGRVAEVRFDGQGCSISLAAASMLTEQVAERPLDEVRELDSAALLDALGIPLGPSRLRCALLSLNALRGALAQQEHQPLRDEDFGQGRDGEDGGVPDVE